MKKAIALVAVIFLLTTTGFKFIKNELGREDAEDARSITSNTADEAASAGILIADLDAQPATIIHDGKEIVIKEAWIEKYAVHRFPFVWFHRRVPAGGYVIAMRPASYVSSIPTGIALWPEGSGAGFGSGGWLFTFYSEEEPVFPLTVQISRGRDRVPVLVLKKKAQQVSHSERP